MAGGRPPAPQQYYRQPQQFQPPYPSPRPKRGKGGLIVVVVVALLAAVAGGYFLFLAGDDGRGGTAADADYDAAVQEYGAAEAAWRVEQGLAPDQAIGDGSWLTGDHLVRRLPGRVVGYDLASGDEVWEFALDGPPKDTCLSSREQSGDRVALLRMTGDGQPSTPTKPAPGERPAAPEPSGCGKLTVLDLGSGEEVFTVELRPDEENELPEPGARPVLTADRVVVDTAPGRVFDLADGTEVPVGQAFAGCFARNLGLFGDLLLADSACPGDTEDTDHRNDEIFRLRAYDATFALTWEWENPKDDKGEPLPVLGVLAADPLVVEVGHRGHETRLLAVDPVSGVAKPFTAYKTDTRGEFRYACTGRGLRDCPTAKAIDGKVILMTSPDQVNPDDPDAAGMRATEFRNELVAFDIGTGDEVWRTGKVPGRTLAMVPAGDGEVIAFQAENPNGAKAMVFAVDPADGEVSPVLPIGPDAMADDRLNRALRNQSFGSDEYDALWRDGLFVVLKLVHRPDTAEYVDTVAFRGR